MSRAQTILGAYIRAAREGKGLTLETLAAKAGISYQYLSGVETGKENFTLQVLEALSNALELPVKNLVASAYELSPASNAPTLAPRFFRPSVPLPEGLEISHVESAANRTQSIIHRINRNMLIEIGQTLQSLIQGNNFSGIVSNIFSDSMDQHSPYKHNHDQRYPDLINKQANGSAGEGLEVKMTLNIGKGGESHNGHSGWHLIGCYNFLENGDIIFVHIMFANLNGHQSENAHWSYLGSKVNEKTGSRRTETYTTNLRGTTRLRDGSIYLNSEIVKFGRWKQEREDKAPPWSIFHAESTPD